MAEIKVNYALLSAAVTNLKSLEKGTGYHPKGGTSKFIDHSMGAMADSTNECYDMLAKIEDELVSIITKTNTILNKAGVDFEKSEIDMLGYYANIFNEGK